MQVLRLHISVAKSRCVGRQEAMFTAGKEHERCAQSPDAPPLIVGDEESLYGAGQVIVEALLGVIPQYVQGTVNVVALRVNLQISLPDLQVNLQYAFGPLTPGIAAAARW